MQRLASVPSQPDSTVWASGNPGAVHPVVFSAPARIPGFAGQVRLHSLPLVVVQNQTNPRHLALLAEKELESDFRVQGNPECQRALASRLRAVSRFGHSKGVTFGRRSPLGRGHFSTPNNNQAAERAVPGLTPS